MALPMDESVGSRILAFGQHTNDEAGIGPCGRVGEWVMSGGAVYSNRNYAYPVGNEFGDAPRAMSSSNTCAG